MKKCIFVFVILCFCSISIFAEPADPTPRYVVQPNGDTICIVQRGDEFVLWYETINGNVVNKDSLGNWKYVVLEDNVLKLSDNLVKQSAVADINFVHSKVQVEEQRNIHTVLSQQREEFIKSLENEFQPYDPDDIETLEAVRKGIKPKTKSQIAFAPSPRGNFKLLTILVQFSDLKFQDEANVRQFYDDMMNKRNFKHPNCDTAAGSVKDYWLDVSSGVLNITSTVVGPYTLEGDKETYSNNYRSARKMVYQAICRAASDIDMSQFDVNGNGIVDGISVIFAGHAKNDNSVDGNAITPHQSIIFPILRDWVWCSKYCVVPELYRGKKKGIGTMCHELGHIFGAMDFYDTNYAKGGGCYKSVGQLDLMATGCYNNKFHSPAHPNPWLKCYLWKWNTVQELSGIDRVYNLYPTENSTDQVYRLSTADDDYYLLENKQQDGLPFKGLIIYHVHKDMNNPGNNLDILFNCVNTRHPQRFYAVDPNSDTFLPTRDVDSYGNGNTNRSFSSSSNTKPFFTSSSKPYNLGWSGKELSSRCDVTMIHEVNIKGETVVRFVLNPTIKGETKFCDDEYFFVDNAPYDADVSWGEGAPLSGGAIPRTLFTIQKEDHNKALYQRKGFGAEGGEISYPAGSALLRACISMHGYKYDLPYKTVNLVPLKAIKMRALNSFQAYTWLPGQTRVFTAENLVGSANNLMWILEGSAMHSTKVLYGAKVNVTPDKYGSLRIRVVDNSGCGPHNETSEVFVVKDLDVIIHRNPASDIAEVTVYEISDFNESNDFKLLSDERVEYMGEYSLELWHERLGCVRQINIPVNTPSVQIDLLGLVSGQYTLRLLIGGQLYTTTQLLVR